MKCLTSVFKQTSNLCFYKFNGSVSGIFPHVTTLTMIACNYPTSILNPSIFPNVKYVHYLSKDPIEYDLYTKASVKWVFPNLSTPFYSTMVETGLGHVDESLITQYIHNMTLIDGNIEFTLNIPEYGIIRGSDYQEEITAFFMKNKADNSYNQYYNQALKRKFMESL